MNRWFGRVGGAVALVVIAACGGDQTMRAAKVYVVAPAGDAPAVMYLTLENRTGVADTLVGVTTNIAQRAELHQESDGAMPSMSGAHHMAMMKSVEGVPVAAGATVRLAPGGYHVMLMQPIVMRPGEEVPVMLRFVRAGEIQATARVIRYADVDSAVGRAQ